MKQLTRRMLALLILIIGVQQVCAQVHDSFLVKGKTLSTEMSTGQKHVYKVRLDQNQFAFLELMQKGADVQITTYDINGNKLEEVDGPNGTSGVENVLLHSSAKGIYRVEVLALGVEGTRPTYDITLKIVRPKGLTPEQKIDELFAPWDNKYSPGASVAVVKDGRVIFEKGYGMANLENSLPNSPATMFHIASATKTFTSYCVLLLEKQGKLSLDDDIRKYIPEVPDFGRTISLRRLAEHTSGIRDYPTLAAMAGYEINTKDTFYKLISRQHDLNFLPGQDYDYSNTGFVLLAEVVERVSGESYLKFVNEHILKPLHMASTVVQDDRGKIIKDVADSYEPGLAGPKKLYVINDLVGSMGILSNVRDLSLWAMHLLKPVGTAADIIKEMSVRGKLANGKLTDYGLGLTIANYKGHEEIGHSGAAGGFKAHIGVFPEDDLAIIVLANASDIYSRPIARQIAEVYFKASPKYYARGGSQPIQTVLQQEQTSTVPTASFDKTSVRLDAYTGIFYSDELETSYEFEVINGRLTARHIFASDMNFRPESKDIFIINGWNGSATFTRDSNERITGCKLNFNRMRNLYFRKLAQPR